MPIVATVVVAVLVGALTVLGLELVHRFGGHPPSAEEVAERTGLRALVRRRAGTMQVSGLALTVALLVLGAAVAALGFTAAAATRTSLWWVDASAADWGSRSATALSTGVLEALTHLGDTVTVVVVALVAGLVDRRLRARAPVVRAVWDGLVFLLLVVLGQKLLTNVIKDVVDRERPPVPHLAEATGGSFPSGHTASAVALYVGLALLFGRGRSRRVQVLLVGVAAAVATAVAASRVLLGVHWVTDVVGGAALSLLWVVAVAFVFGGRRLRHAAELPEADTAADANPDAGMDSGEVGRTNGHRQPTPGGTMDRTPPEQGPTEDQVDSRAAALAAEPKRGEDPRRQAEALLAESEARVEDPAARTPGDDDVVRRSSDEGVIPEGGG